MHALCFSDNRFFLQPNLERITITGPNPKHSGHRKRNFILIHLKFDPLLDLNPELAHVGGCLNHLTTDDLLKIL